MIKIRRLVKLIKSPYRSLIQVHMNMNNSELLFLSYPLYPLFRPMKSPWWKNNRRPASAPLALPNLASRPGAPLTRPARLTATPPGRPPPPPLRPSVRLASPPARRSPGRPAAPCTFFSGWPPKPGIINAQKKPPRREIKGGAHAGTHRPPAIYRNLYLA